MFRGAHGAIFPFAAGLDITNQSVTPDSGVLCKTEFVLCKITSSGNTSHLPIL